MNKYLSQPEEIVDLHGLTRLEAEEALDALFEEEGHKHVRIITGRGIHSANGPVLRTFVQEYLTAKNISYNRSKLQDGGEGAFEVFFG